MIKSISSLLFYSNNLDKTFEFYKTLGFEVEKKETVIFYVNWFKVEFVEKKHDEPKNPSMFVKVKVDDLKEIYEKIQKVGVRVTDKTKKEFVVTDPDGYRLFFFN